MSARSIATKESRYIPVDAGPSSILAKRSRFRRVDMLARKPPKIRLSGTLSLIISYIVSSAVVVERGATMTLKTMMMRRKAQMDC